MFKHEIFCNEKDWNVVYEDKTKQYHLAYSGNPDLHVHAPGLYNSRLWFHKHVKTGKVYVVDPSIEFSFSDANELTKYIKAFGIDAPSEELIKLISKANRNGRDTKSNT